MPTPPTPDLPAEAAAAVARLNDLIDGKAPERAEPEHPLDRFTAQSCPARIHPDWAVDSEDAHTCPWCEIKKLRADQAAVRTAALTEAANAAATWTGDDTPEEDRPGYDGATIDPEDRLREAIDPEVGPGRREQLITEYRDMVVGEIAGELRRLAAAPSEPFRNCYADEAVPSTVDRQAAYEATLPLSRRERRPAAPTATTATRRTEL